MVCLIFKILLDPTKPLLLSTLNQVQIRDKFPLYIPLTGAGAHKSATKVRGKQREH